MVLVEIVKDKFKAEHGFVQLRSTWSVEVDGSFVWRHTSKPLAAEHASNLSKALNGKDTKVMYVERAELFTEGGGLESKDAKVE